MMSSRSFLLVAILLFMAPTLFASHLRRRVLQSALEEKDYGVVPKIVNGWDTEENEFPFFVRWGGCGASLIAKDFVLSAAHCNVQDGNDMRLGAWDYTDGGTTVSIKNRFTHPNNEDNGLMWDYLLLQLTAPVENAQPVTLNADANVPGESGTLKAIGMGRLNYEPGDKPERLMEVDVPNHDKSYCEGAYGSLDWNIMLCAGNAQYDSCIGDSGGPILDSNGVQVGITSFGDGCAKEGKPGVYSRVSTVFDWISSTVCTNSVDPPSFCGNSAADATSSPVPFPTIAPTSSPTIAPTSGPTIAPTSVPTVPVTTTPTISAAPPTTQVATTRACADSTASFPIFGSGQYTCSWLASNLATHSVLCEFVDVAQSCLQTCGKCPVIGRFDNR